MNIQDKIHPIVNCFLSKNLPTSAMLINAVSARLVRPNGGVWSGLMLIICGLLSCSANGEEVQTASGESIDIKVAYDKTKIYQTQYLIEHSGSVSIEYVNDDSENQTFPIDVKSRFQFIERFVGNARQPQSVRSYNVAMANILLNEKDVSSELSSINRLIVTRIRPHESNKYQIASAGNLLSQRELDLLRNPADPLSYPDLLSKSNVEVGQSWEPSRDSLARFLMVDLVTQSDVKIELKELSNNQARIHLTGRVKADVDDSQTEIALAGIAQVDLDSAMVTAFRMNLDENRRTGQIAPGYSGRTKIDIRMGFSDLIPQLSDDSLRELAQSRSIRNLLKWESESQSFELQYDPAWKLISNGDDAAVLRYVDNGDLLVQCNIVRIASRPADNPLTLTEFKNEVTKAISKDPNSKILDTEQGENAFGLKILRVVVGGIEEEVPVNWIYYNVASPDGRQVTFIFTAEEQVANRISVPSQKLVDGFLFHKRNSKLDSTRLPLPEPRDAKKTDENIR